MGLSIEVELAPAIFGKYKLDPMVHALRLITQVLFLAHIELLVTFVTDNPITVVVLPDPVTVYAPVCDAPAVLAPTCHQVESLAAMPTDLDVFLKNVLAINFL